MNVHKELIQDAVYQNCKYVCKSKVVRSGCLETKGKGVCPAAHPVFPGICHTTGSAKWQGPYLGLLGEFIWVRSLVLEMH